MSGTALPEVSVIVPAYNAQATLGETLESVLAQTFTDLELIVVDDGSTDGTAAVANAIDDARVRLVWQPNAGVAQARNRGIVEARGELVAFLDADDLWRPSKLGRQVELLLSEADAGVCVTAATQIDVASRELAPMPLLHATDYCELLLLKSMVVGCISSCLVRSGVISAAGPFNPAFSQCADWDFWLRLSRVTRFALLDSDLVLYRVHGANMSGDVRLLESDSFAVLDSFYQGPSASLYAHVRRRAYSNHWLICSGSYLHAGRLRDALRCLLRGLLAYPANLSRPLGLPLRWLRRAHHALRSAP